MSILNQFENDQRLLSELKELFECVPPGQLRRSIEDVFFNLLMAEDEYLPGREAASHVYLLINFLNEAEQRVPRPL